MFITTFSIFFTWRAVKNDSFMKSSTFLTINHTLYTLAILVNMTVMIVYWSIIHWATIENHRREGPWTKVLCQYWIHLAPAACCLIHTLMTNMVMAKSHTKHIVVFGTLYYLFNFYITISSNEPIYAFLPWKTDFFGALMNATAILLGAIAIFLGFCVADSSLKSYLFQTQMKSKRQKKML